MNDPKLIEALGNASSLELFELSTLIERLLADPRRIMAIRSQLHLGQTVRFFDWRDQQIRSARVTAMKDAQVTLFEDGARREWKLPYAPVEPPTKTDALDTAAPTPKPAAPPKPKREGFQRGDKVAFDDRYLQTQIGTISRVNQRTASVDCGDESWRVPFAMLQHVLDV